MGIKIFQAFLENEGVDAYQLAYDRPSKKLYPFLAKYFELNKPILQSNNFAVYPRFFGDKFLSDEIKSSVTKENSSSSHGGYLSGAGNPYQQQGMNKSSINIYEKEKQLPSSTWNRIMKGSSNFSNI